MGCYGEGSQGETLSAVELLEEVYRASSQFTGL